MTAIKPLEIKRLAQKLKVSRAVFAAAYDEVADAYGGLTFKVVAELQNLEEHLPPGQDRDRRDYFAAMRKANEDDWLVEFVFEKFADLAAPDQGASDASSIRPVLQSIANRQQRFQEADKITMGTLTAMRRCCVIKAVTKTQDSTTREAVGSGFLIGPHLVLTNHHVISRFLGEDGAPLNGNTQPYVEFDYHAGRSRIMKPQPYDLLQSEGRSWLLAHSPKVPETVDETAETLAANLDYAVLILDGRPGDMRGFYSLSDILNDLPIKLPPVGNPLQLWQFPNSQPMKVVSNLRSPPPPALSFPDDETDHPRVYYVVNSDRGSSGGLVLDDASKAMALHDAGFNADAPQDARKNRGVPLHMIARDAISIITQEISNQPKKAGWHPKRKLPIIGRQTLQNHIFDAAYRNGRIIAVMTIPDDNAQRIPKLGRSYTREIIESCLPADKHHIVSVGASLIDPDPFLTAHRIVSTINPALATELPLPTGETTLDADATGILVQETVAALQAAAPDKIVWLMIDDIDSDPIGTQWGSSSFLVALYRRIARSDTLRVVLAGLPRRLEGLQDIRAQTGVILEDLLTEEPTDAERTDWIAAHLTHDMQPHELAPRLSSLVAGVAFEQADGSNGGAAPSSARLSKTEALNRLLSSHGRTAFLTGDRDD